MNPEELKGLLTIVTIIEKISTWPFGIVIMVILVGPWMMAIVIAGTYKRRFEAVVGMYQSNVKLVEVQQSISKDLKEVIIDNTQCWQEVSDAVRTNQFCPMVRLKKKAEGVSEG